MTEREFQEALQEVLENGFDLEEGVVFYDEGERIDHVSTFDDRGLLTRNKGLVITLEDGSEFQLTIVRSDRGTSTRVEEEDD